MSLLRNSSFVILRFFRSIQNPWKNWIALDIVSKALRVPFGHGALTSCLSFPAFAGMTFSLILRISQQRQDMLRLREAEEVVFLPEILPCPVYFYIPVLWTILLSNLKNSIAE